MTKEKIPSEQALRYLAYNPEYALVIFRRLSQKVLLCLKAKIIVTCERPPERTDGYMAPAMFFSSVSPLVEKALLRITLTKRDNSKLFKKLTNREVSSLVESIEKALPVASDKALAEAKKALKRRRGAFINKPSSLPDDIPFSGLASKKVSPRRAAKKKYCIGTGASALHWAGRGRMPQRFRDAIESGASLEDFLIDKSTKN